MGTTVVATLVLACYLALAVLAIGHTNTDCFYEVKGTEGDYEPPKLTRHTPLPDLNGTRLASYVWPDGKVSNRSMFYGTNATAILAQDGCNCLYRYKVIGGRLYHDKPESPFFSGLSRVCQYDVIKNITREMLLLALYTYDLPDLDIVIVGGERHDCSFSYPFLAYIVTVDKYYGVTMPLYNTWMHFSSSKEQTIAQHKCLTRVAEKGKQVPRVLWRGRSTGYTAVWQNGVRKTANTSTSMHDKLVMKTSLILKRVHAVFMGAPFDFMDVKLTKLNLLPAMSRFGSEDLERELTYAMVSQDEETVSIPMDEWNKYAIQLSLDGYGPAFREPVQMLGSSVLLRPRSPLLLWYHQLLKDGVHVETFEYDNLDLIPRSKALIEEFVAGSDRLKKMVKAMNEFAFDVFTLESQLRSFVYSLLKAQQINGWKPILTNEFELVKNLPYKWTVQFFSREVKKQIVKELADNFMPWDEEEEKAMWRSKKKYWAERRKKQQAEEKEAAEAEKAVEEKGKEETEQGKQEKEHETGKVV